MIIPRKLAEQQKKQRALKIKKRIHDVKLAESLSPITKKLDTISDSTKNLGEVFKELTFENENNQEIVPVEIGSDNSEDDNTKLNIKALPNSSIFSESMA